MNRDDLIEYLQGLPEDACMLTRKRTITTDENGEEVEHKFIDALMFENKESKEFIEWFLMP